jgi:EmrB/QacA subfamily drug resistance transporter
MVVLIVANFMDLLDTTIVNVALPSLSADVGASDAQVEWVVGAYTLGLAATLVLGGRLGDRFGRRSVFVTGVLGFTVASLLCALAPAGATVVAARAAQGVFAGLMVPQVLATVQDLYEPERRGPIFGLVGFITGAASVAGPLLGGWLVDADPFGIGWRGVFAVNVPVGILLAVAALFVVPARPFTERGRGDLPGVLLATFAAVTVMVVLVDGREAGWPVWCWVSLGVGVVALIGFCLRELAVDRRQRAGERITPFLPLRLFRDRNFAAGTLVNFVYQAGLVSFLLYLALFLQQGLGFSPMQAGLTWLGFSIGTLLSSVLASTPVAGRHRRIVMSAGALLTAAGFAWTSLTAASGDAQAIHNGWPFTSALALAGIGLGGLILPLFWATLEKGLRPEAGGANGAQSMLQQVGGAIGVALVGLVFYSTTDLAVAFGTAGLISAALLAAAAAASLTLGRHNATLSPPVTAH